MIQVRVIAPMGAVVHGPAKLQLSREQLARRGHLVGRPDGKGVVALKDGSLAFKLGEVFGIDAFDGKLNAALFEDVAAAAKAAKATAQATSGTAAGA